MFLPESLPDFQEEMLQFVLSWANFQYPEMTVFFNVNQFYIKESLSSSCYCNQKFHLLKYLEGQATKLNSLRVSRKPLY